MYSSPRDFDFSGLSTRERLLLAKVLLDSVVVELAPLTPAEVERRLAATGISPGE